ncbi:MlaD family protein [bacterium]|nr:MlaD family protein [bacterium]
MARQKTALWTGVFVLGGTVIAIAALIWLGVADFLTDYQKFVTYFDSSVQGLNIDSEVKFRGIKVGRVEEMKTAPDGTLIEVRLELNQDFTVQDTLRAKLQLTGITGMKYIELDYVERSKRNSYPALSFSPPEKYRVIPSAQAGVEQIEEALQDIYSQIMNIQTGEISIKTVQFLESGTRAFNSFNEFAGGAEMKTLVVRIDDLAETIDSLTTALNVKSYDADIDTALSHFKSSMLSLDNAAESLQYQTESMAVNVKVDTLFNRVNRLVEMSMVLVQQSHYSTNQIMNRFSSTVIELNAALEQLNSLIMSTERYPSNILYSEPPAKEK